MGVEIRNLKTKQWHDSHSMFISLTCACESVLPRIQNAKIALLSTESVEMQTVEL